jgi:hypothetical protein
MEMHRQPMPRPESPRQHFRSRRRFWVLLILLSGCAHPPNQLKPQLISELDAAVLPPAGWTLDRADQSGRYVQRVWASPSGKTSYGVIRFTLPIPVGPEIALVGFLAEMRRNEGDADLIEKRRDPDHPGRLSFIAAGGRYRVNGIIVTRGFRGWAVYAGTLRNGPEAVDELELAVQARDNTTLGPAE